MEEERENKRVEGSATTPGKLKIKLPVSVTAKSKEECRRSLVVKVISAKNVGYGALSGTLNAIWKCKKGFSIIGLNTNLYQVQFDLELDGDKVLMGCPWYHDSQLMIIKKWRPGIEKEESAFNLAPIWVQVWGLQLDWVSEEAGEEICKHLGQVVQKQVVLGGSKYGKFVRCLVEFDTSKPLIQGMYVEQEGTEVWVNFKYEFVSLYCAYCGVIGHSSSCCYAKVIDQNAGIYKEETFGPDLHGVPIKSLGDSPLVKGNLQRQSESEDYVVQSGPGLEKRDEPEKNKDAEPIMNAAMQPPVKNDERMLVDKQSEGVSEKEFKGKGLLFQQARGGGFPYGLY